MRQIPIDVPLDQVLTNDKIIGKLDDLAVELERELDRRGGADIGLADAIAALDGAVAAIAERDLWADCDGPLSGGVCDGSCQH